MKLSANEVELGSGLIVSRDDKERLDARNVELREEAQLYKSLVMQSVKDDRAVARREEAARTLEARQRRVLARGRRSHVMNPYQATDQYLGYDKPKFPTHEQLRAVADRCTTVTAALSRRNFQQRTALKKVPRNLFGAVGWNIVHKDFDEPDFKMSKAQLARADELSESFETPHETEASFVEFACKSLRETLTIDRVAVELIPSELARMAPGVKKNSIVGFCITDGATIKPIYEAAAQWVKVEPRYKDKQWDQSQAEKIFAFDMRDRFGLDLTNKTYVQIVDGVPFGAFTDEDMIVHINSPRSEIGTYGYGEAPTEKAIWAVLAYMQLWGYQVNNFSEALPEILLCVAGAADDDLMTDVEDQLADLAQGVKRSHRVPIIQVEEKGGIQSVQLRKSLADMGFGEWETRITSLILANYGMHPFEINQASIPNGQSTLQEANKDAEIELHSQGFMALLLDQERLFNKIVERFDPDYRFRWFGIRGLYQGLTKEEHDVFAGKTKAYGSVNDTRAEVGMPVLDKDYFKSMGNSAKLSVQLATLMSVPTDTLQFVSVLLNSDRQLEQEAKLEAQQAQQQPQPGDPGQDQSGDGGAGGDDGTGDINDPELQQLLQGIDLGDKGGGDKKTAAKPAGKPGTKPAAKPEKVKKAWSDDVIYVKLD